ncbi:response regulator transcription factor [Streptomyces sp. SID10815]|uniref:response regulator n=1 Tax=Streptomyces sp. SID10815 TaxID=2706027 RepID=UPI0013C8E58C|nr:response regulator transcription factor [Streptomyces sp. SID10815]NEA47463.1 response regulator transcription factor [Streptomyces sp. SID10815]
MSLRVLVCNDLPIVLDGLRSLIEAEPDMLVIGTTDSGMEAIMMARAQRPDVVVTGLDLQGINGTEMIRRLLREPGETPPRVVALAMNDDDETLVSLLHLGVNGVLVRGATGQELSAAVRSAAKGQTTLAPQIATRLVDWYRRDSRGRSEALRIPTEEITARERQVLTLLAHGHSTEEVAEQLSIGVTTVRTHLYRLRCKLDVRDRVQLVSLAYRAGLIQSA